MGKATCNKHDRDLHPCKGQTQINEKSPNGKMGKGGKQIITEER